MDNSPQISLLLYNIIYKLYKLSPNRWSQISRASIIELNLEFYKWILEFEFKFHLELFNPRLESSTSRNYQSRTLTPLGQNEKCNPISKNVPLGDKLPTEVKN